MFTGIVEATGEVLAVEDDGGERRLEIETPFAELTPGQSISVSGACLTVETVEGSEDGGDGAVEADASERTTVFSTFLSTETLDRTYFDDVGAGDLVNLERAMPADGRFDGHVVQGHVDATAEVCAVESIGEDREFRFSLPSACSQYVVEKGSIAVDGISLTVADEDGDEFGVAVVPTTDDLTTLSTLSPGDPVHLEVDVIAKYVAKLVQDSPADGSSVVSDANRR